MHSHNGLLITSAVSLSLSLSLSHWAGELQRGIPDKTGLPQEELEDSMVYSRQK